MPSTVAVNCTLPDSILIEGILSSKIAIPSSAVATKELLLVTPNLSESLIANRTFLLEIPPLSAFKT